MHPFPYSILAFLNSILDFPDSILAFPYSILAFLNSILDFLNLILDFSYSILAFLNSILDFPYSILDFPYSILENLETRNIPKVNLLVKHNEKVHMTCFKISYDETFS